MSSRKGNVVLFKDVADEAYRRVQAVIAERNPDLTEAQRHDTSTKVGLGAITYAMLEVDTVRDIVFEWEAALSFDGKSAPYIQNAYVRANSLLKKAEAAGETPAAGAGGFHYPLDKTEVEVIDLLARFPGVVRQAAADYKPLHIATYAYDLAKAFHGFYHSVPVIQTEDAAVRQSRLRLVAAARQGLANALHLLVIQAPDVM